MVARRLAAIVTIAVAALAVGAACAMADALVTACAPQPGRLTVTLLRAGRRVARRTVTAATGGIVTVRLHRPAGASAGELRARVSSR